MRAKPECEATCSEGPDVIERNRSKYLSLQEKRGMERVAELAEMKTQIAAHCNCQSVRQRSLNSKRGPQLTHEYVHALYQTRPG